MRVRTIDSGKIVEILANEVMIKPDHPSGERRALLPAPFDARKEIVRLTGSRIQFGSRAPSNAFNLSVGDRVAMIFAPLSTPDATPEVLLWGLWPQFTTAWPQQKQRSRSMAACQIPVHGKGFRPRNDTGRRIVPPSRL